MHSSDNDKGVENQVIDFAALPWLKLALAWPAISIIIFVLFLSNDALNFLAVLLAKLQLALGGELSGRAWLAPVGQNLALLGDLDATPLAAAAHPALLGLAHSVCVALYFLILLLMAMIIWQLTLLVLELRGQLDDYPLISADCRALRHDCRVLESRNAELQEALSLAIKQRDAARRKGPLDGWMAGQRR